MINLGKLNMQYHLQAQSPDGRWYALPYRFPTREALNAFMAIFREKNPGRIVRGGA